MNLKPEDEWNFDKNCMSDEFVLQMNFKTADKGNPPINKTITELPIGSEVVIEDKNDNND